MKLLIKTAMGLSLLAGSMMASDVRAIKDDTNVETAVAVVIGDRSIAQIGGVYVENSTVTGNITSTTTGDTAVAVVIGDDSTAMIGGVTVINSNVRGTIDSTTRFKTAVAVVIGDKSRAQIGGVMVR